MLCRGCGAAEHPELAGQTYVDGENRLCWLHANDARYRDTPATKQPVCPQLWKRVRDESGAIKKRRCESG